MRRILTLWAMIVLLSTVVHAQNLQKGCVRTPERYVGKRFIESVYIPGVKIEIEGRANPEISGEDGQFDFPVAGRTYRINKVSGGRYSLLDMRLLHSDHYYSSQEDLEILVTNVDDDLEYQLALTRNERNNFQRKTEWLRQENERLKQEGRITEEQYKRRHQELIERYEKEDQLIKDMVEEYMKLDFKSLDDYNRAFNMARIDGDFQKMDSLQRSRGDILGDTRKLIEEGAVIEQRRRDIELADSLRREQLNIKAQECYNSFLMYKEQSNRDSAALFIELRAAIDTTNVEWQLEAGRYIEEYIADYNKALEYYQRALRWAIKQNGEQNPDVATSYNNIGEIYRSQGNYSLALEYHEKALKICQDFYGENHPDVATSYNNIGLIYHEQGNYSLALEYQEKALKIRQTSMARITLM